MPKASLTLPNGTVVQIEGTTEEVRDLLQHYGAAPAPDHPASRAGKAVRRRVRRAAGKSAAAAKPADRAADSGPDLSQIVNLAKNCDEAEDIERQILDRASQVDRTLLPLYLVHEHLENAFGLSSGEVSKVTTDLGVPVSQPNASKTLSGTAAKYVIGDRVRKKGQLVRYKLSRRGLQYMQSVISGGASENAG
jgi:hypothetical protein